MALDPSSGFPKIGIAGAYRTGKTSRKIKAVQLRPDLFEVATKYKVREEGPWASDSRLESASKTGNIESGLLQMRESMRGPIDPALRGIVEEEYRESQTMGPDLNKDSIYVTAAQFQDFKKSGKIAFDYLSWDTRHGVETLDAIRADKHMIYLTDTMRGWLAYDNHFDPIIGMLLRTDPWIINRRLEAAKCPPDNIPEATLQQRLHFFQQEQSLLLQNASRFHFLMDTRSDEPQHCAYTSEEIALLNDAQISRDTERMIELIELFKTLYRPGMTVQQLHEARIDSHFRKLLNKGLADVRAAKKPLELNLSGEFEEYRQGREILPRGLIGTINNLLVAYEPAHGRHNLLIYKISEGALSGVSVPSQEKKAYPAEDSPEELILDFIYKRLGIKPLERFAVYGTGLLNEIDSGQINVVNAMLRNGAFISLGDPLPNVPAHASLNIAFAYPINGKVAKVSVYTTDQINNSLPHYLRPRPESNGGMKPAVNG